MRLASAGLGEIERLDHILTAIDDKLDEIQRADRRVVTIEVPRPDSKRLRI